MNVFLAKQRALDREAEERDATRADAAELMRIAARLSRRNGAFATAKRLILVASLVLSDFGIARDFIASVLADLNGELDSDDRGVRH